MRVLIVDDEAPVRHFLVRCVAADGIDVMQAASAEEALDVMVREGVPAVALCDINLPNKNGVWLAQQLRQTSPATAVVMTTGVRELDVAVTTMHAGAVDYVVKPFTRERVAEALKRGLRAYQSYRDATAMEVEVQKQRERVTKALSELEVNGWASVDAFLTMLDVRDRDASDRARRVARVAVSLALTLGIREPQLSDVERGALLHDVGGLSAPDARAILERVPFLAAAGEIVSAVHERHDGSGHPRGLKRDDIPVGARIVAVAHAYDALVSGTAGVHAAPASAIRTLARKRGQAFDPDVLDALATLQGATET